MFWNKKKKQVNTKPISHYRKPQPIPKWQPTKTLGNMEKKSEKEKSQSMPEKVKTDWEREFLKTFNKLTACHRAWDVWRDLIIMYACALSNAVDKTNYDAREKRYMQIIKKYNKEEQQIFPELVAQITMALEDNPEQDFLGKIFMGLNLGNGTNGQFFTPYHICELMAEIAMDNVEEEIKQKGYISVNDPCCGAGATLIAGIHAIRKRLEKCEPAMNYQNHVLVIEQDIDEIVALMCYIQLSLLGVAGYIKVGNSIVEPMVIGEKTDKYWFTPMYFSEVWQMRRTIQNFKDLCERKEK